MNLFSVAFSLFVTVLFILYFIRRMKTSTPEAVQIFCTAPSSYSRFIAPDLYLHPADNTLTDGYDSLPHS